ncbi:type II toxin-antitoxin system RelE/ParE family toxin [Rhizobium sp. WL3]|uniref:type II toxin-antitoxin system RelE/ParE family toxin n=1 Tax=Rhizobium sp. WL3 TaxID=2603277 RepID=UPI001FEE1A6D|nr:type II toxin-antitoxin system RelE/ParE family toxin [Rhizobium sp. WL3]
MLCVDAKEIEDGLVDARLGGFLLKKRVAAPGRGKSGSYRTIVGHRQADRLIFVHGFAKNEADHVKKSEKTALRKLCDI